MSGQRRPKPWNWQIAAAVFLSLGMGGFSGWQMHGAVGQPSAGMAALAGETRSSYVAYASEQVRISARWSWCAWFRTSSRGPSPFLTSQRRATGMSAGDSCPPGGGAKTPERQGGGGASYISATGRADALLSRGS